MHPFSSTFVDSTSVQDVKYNRVWDNAVSFLETSSLEKKEDIQGRIRQLIINLYKVPQKNPCSIWMFQTQNCLVSQADVHIYRALVTEHWLQKHIQAHSGEKKRKWIYQKEFWERGGNDQSKLVSFWVFPRWGCPVSLWVRGRVWLSASGSVRFFKRISCYTVTHILPTPWTIKIQCVDPSVISHQGLLTEPTSYCIRPCMAFELFMDLVSWYSMVRNQRGACPGTELLLSRQLY